MSITYTRSPLLPCHSTYILYHIISHRVESFRVPGSVPPTVVRSKSSFVHSLPQLTHKTTSDSTSSTLTSHHYNRAEQVSLICGRCLCAINRHSSNKDDGEVEDNDISSALYPAMHRSTHQDSPFPTVNCSMFSRHQTLIHISIRYRWQSHIRICPHLFFLLPKENGSLICAANATKSLHSRIIVQRPTLLFH